MLDFDEVRLLLSVKKTKQLLRDFEGLKFKKLKQLEGLRVGQVDNERVVF